MKAMSKSDLQTTPRRMTKREARRWVRLHWAAYMSAVNVPDPCPEEIAEVWRDECLRMADRIAPPAEVNVWITAYG